MDNYQSSPLYPHVMVAASGGSFLILSDALKTQVTQSIDSIFERLPTLLRGSLKSGLVPPDTDCPDYILWVSCAPEAARDFWFPLTIRALDDAISTALLPLGIMIGEPCYNDNTVGYKLSGSRQAIAQGKMLAERAACDALSRDAVSNVDGGGAAADIFANTDVPGFEAELDKYIAGIEELLVNAYQLRAMRDNPGESVFPWMTPTVNTFESQVVEQVSRHNSLLKSAQLLADLVPLVAFERCRDLQVKGRPRWTDSH